MKRLGVLVLSLAIIVVIVGCSNETNADSELDLGIEALENENLDEAKEHFEKASDEEQEEAKEYVDIIESAEFIHESIKEDDLEEAVDTYVEIEENAKFPQVTFIFADEQETLTQILEERKMIDEHLRALTDFFDPEAPAMSANDLFLLQSNELLEQEHLTSEQEAAILEFQEAVQNRIAELANSSDAGQESSGDEEETGKTDEKEEAGGTSEADKDEEQEESASKTLSHEEAKKAVYEFLYGEGAGGTDDSNFKLDYDHHDGDTYVFHYYEVVNQGDGGGHTATLGWYAVDSKTGEVTDIMK